MKCQYIVYFLKILQMLAETAVFGTVIALCTLSSKDPFKSHIIGNITNYFNIQHNTINSIQYCSNDTDGNYYIGVFHILYYIT